jgi:hypothetical protein
MKTAFSFDYASTASGYENKLLIDQAPAYRKLRDYNKWKTTRNSVFRALQGGGRLGREFGGVLKHNLQLGGSWVASGGLRLGRELAVAY